MKKYIYVFFALLIVNIYGCNNQTEYSLQLVAIDSLFNKESYEMILKRLNGIDEKRLGNSDKAYYLLLKSITFYNNEVPIISDSDISKSVLYFREATDKKHLALAQLYHGTILIGLKRYKEAAICLKEAEQLANDLRDEKLYVRTCLELAYLNAVSDNLELTYTFAKKMLVRAKESGNKEWKGYCYHLIAFYYSKKQMMDSSDYYRRLSIPYLENQSKRKRYIQYNNVATYYWRQKDYKKAEDYLRKSLSLKPWEMTYGILAEMLMEQGRMTEADSLWDKAMVTDDKEVRARLMWPYSEWLWKRGRKQEAWDVAMQLPMLKDTLANKRQAEALQSLQYGYEQQLSELHHRNDIQTLVIIALLVALSLMVGCSVVWLRLRKTKKRLMVTQNEIDAYALRLKVEQAEIGALKRERQQLKISHTSKTRQLRELQDQESALNKQLRERERKVRDLQDKMQVLREEQGEMLARGKRLYDEIVSGGTTKGWHKRDYVDFLSYYRMDHRDFFDEIKENGSNLTPREKCFLAFYDMGFDKQQILLIMGLTKSAYRTVISRIKGKVFSYNFPE